jgi:flagellar biosynthesis/type III secretory pathway M-ring protein FliF/YscJ
MMFLTTGFIIIYKGAFSCKYQVLSSVLFFITYLIFWSLTSSSNKLEHKILSFTVLLIIGLLHQYINPKAAYIVCNIKTHDLLDILSEVLKNQNINYNITNNSILLDFPDKKIIKVKPIMLSLNFLSLSDIDNTDLHTTIEDNLEIALNQMTRKKIPLFGSIVFAIGLITIILFYSSITHL